LFGTTDTGGPQGAVAGTVFELVKTATGYASMPTILASFNSTDGGDPAGGLIADAAGDLFGTTEFGGTDNSGTVFEIAKTATGYASAPITLANFNMTNGYLPQVGLVADAAGDLFGTTYEGGPNSDGTVFEIANSGFYVTCFRSGTGIATTRGLIPVEALSVGDFVHAQRAGIAPIKWIGHRRVDCRHHPKPERVWPVCVSAGAFGDNLPHRDLWLSPDHAVFVDDVLIPIKYLINSISIKQVPQNEVIYYHIELARHDVLLAEGLLPESYLDCGDYSNFDNSDVLRLVPNFAVHPINACALWETYGCAPLVITGHKLTSVRHRLGDRAAMLEQQETCRRLVA